MNNWSSESRKIKKNPKLPQPIWIRTWLYSGHRTWRNDRHTHRQGGTGWVSSSDEDAAESPGNSEGLSYTIGTRRWAANLDKVINKEIGCLEESSVRLQPSRMMKLLAVFSEHTVNICIWTRGRPCLCYGSAACRMMASWIWLWSYQLYIFHSALHPLSTENNVQWLS